MQCYATNAIVWSDGPGRVVEMVLVMRSTRVRLRHDIWVGVDAMFASTLLLLHIPVVYNCRDEENRPWVGLPVFRRGQRADA